MNKVLIFSLLMGAYTAISYANTVHEKLYSEKGYPYKELIQRSDSVKIFYTEKDALVNCKVEVNNQQDVWTSTAVSITKDSFTEAPLASCLKRNKAKEILASTYIK